MGISVEDLFAYKCNTERGESLAVTSEKERTNLYSRAFLASVLLSHECTRAEMRVISPARMIIVECGASVFLFFFFLALEKSTRPLRRFIGHARHKQ